MSRILSFFKHTRNTSDFAQPTKNLITPKGNPRAFHRTLLSICYCYCYNCCPRVFVVVLYLIFYNWCATWTLSVRTRPSAPLSDRTRSWPDIKGSRLAWRKCLFELLRKPERSGKVRRSMYRERRSLRFNRRFAWNARFFLGPIETKPERKSGVRWRDRRTCAAADRGHGDGGRAFRRSRAVGRKHGTGSTNAHGPRETGTRGRGDDRRETTRDRHTACRARNAFGRRTRSACRRNKRWPAPDTLCGGTGYRRLDASRTSVVCGRSRPRDVHIFTHVRVYRAYTARAFFVSVRAIIFETCPATPFRTATRLARRPLCGGQPSPKA